jgi:hypothetical protein
MVWAMTQHVASFNKKHGSQLHRVAISSLFRLSMHYNLIWRNSQVNKRDTILMSMCNECCQDCHMYDELQWRCHEGCFIYWTKTQIITVRYGVTDYVIFLITLHDISSSDEHILVIVTKTSIEHEFLKIIGICHPRP